MAFIIGTVVGIGIAKFFILPDDVMNLRLAAMTIGDLLRIGAGVVVIVIGAGIGASMDFDD